MLQLRQRDDETGVAQCECEAVPAPRGPKLAQSRGASHGSKFRDPTVPNLKRKLTYFEVRIYFFSFSLESSRSVIHITDE
jgi:hypothetical protein